jgi:uncharacterized Zn-finger protein
VAILMCKGKNHASGNDKVNVLCPNCGKTFSAFMKQIAEHNAKVTCPRCDTIYETDRKQKI